MERKTIAPFSVLEERRTLALSEVGNIAASVCSTLSARAAALGLTVTGPTIFVAHGLPKDPDTLFPLSFCLPVTPEAAEGTTHLSSINAACAVYEGPLSGLFSHGYQPLLADMAEAGLTPTGESREVYHRWTGPNHDDNRIEIQFAVA